MVQAVEKCQGEDEQNSSKIESKHGSENYCFMMRNTFPEDEFIDKFGGDEKDRVKNEAFDWFDMHHLAEKDELESRHKELEGVVTPIVLKA